MARGDYQATGQAFLGERPLGAVEWQLFGTETLRMRKADGEIVFEDGLDRDCIGYRIRLDPENEASAFTVVVTAVRDGRIIIASDGEMPWWPR